MSDLDVLLQRLDKLENSLMGILMSGSGEPRASSSDFISAKMVEVISASLSKALAPIYKDLAELKNACLIPTVQWEAIGYALKTRGIGRMKMMKAIRAGTIESRRVPTHGPIPGYLLRIVDLDKHFPRRLKGARPKRSSHGTLSSEGSNPGESQ